jgi:RNA polymerase sigma factor (sigma-70 family)
MAEGQLSTVLRHLRAAVRAPALEALNDGQLLEEFTASRQEAAFEALVRRHGPLVFGVCRRLLRDGHLAEDAFQATFLVLFRKARSLDRSGPLAGWLHTVACHVALRARESEKRRERRERAAGDARPAEAAAEAGWQDLRDVLDEELGRLPEQCRRPAVLCYLEGKTNDEAARVLNVPPGTLRSRLVRARRLLRERLLRRGVTLSVA